MSSKQDVYVPAQVVATMNNQVVLIVGGDCRADQMRRLEAAFPYTKFIWPPPEKLTPASPPSTAKSGDPTCRWCCCSMDLPGRRTPKGFIGCTANYTSRCCGATVPQ